jgi:hypothetical protein
LEESFGGRDIDIVWHALITFPNVPLFAKLKIYDHNIFLQAVLCMIENQPPQGL